ncbi:MAG: YgdI/YgdR family lipoprotein [Verrucomicrobia bacterium]|nr:YgdI/YgdR family lipoprotein [Verrucomicrobiota bacterium]
MSNSRTVRDAGLNPARRTKTTLVNSPGCPLMKNRLLSIGALCAALLTGCARHYNLKLANGSIITTATKPRLEHGSYHFKDGAGKDVYIPASRVREIAPASMSKESEPQFKPASRP